MLNTSFLDYKCPTALDVPNLQDAGVILGPVLHNVGPFGAKAVGEAVMITRPPSIAQAIYETVGVRIGDTPITKEKIFSAIKKNLEVSTTSLRHSPS
jgi:CO/xanthine dehydrogenase Mo-binding subunit